MSTYTTNKSIEQPAAGAYNNDWNVPVNADWAIIDTALGGTTSISVTGVAMGTYPLALSQYQPINIEFTGTLSANLTYALPTGVGGLWSVYNNAMGSFTLSFGISGGSAIPLAAGGLRTLILSDGVNVGNADTAYAYAQAAAAETAAVTAAATHSNNASNLSSGTVPNAQLPNAAVGPGVTIAANPGSAPTPTAPGQIWYYY
jgi:hypothetical protein